MPIYNFKNLMKIVREQSLLKSKNLLYKKATKGVIFEL